MSIKLTTTTTIFTGFLILCGFTQLSAQIWGQTHKVVPFDRRSGDVFGTSVSISGNYALISAAQSDTDENGGNILSSAGGVYIYKMNSGQTWDFAQKIVAADRSQTDYFGFSADISGDIIFVGAPNQDQNVNGSSSWPDAGAGYFYSRNPVSDTWVQTQKVVASDRLSLDQFGHSVGISGDYAIAGAWGKNDSSGNMLDHGSAYFFERDINGVWNEVQIVTAPDKAANDEFGRSVAISGNYAVVGAWKQDLDAFSSNPVIDAGAAYIYERNGNGVWNLIQKVTPSLRADQDYFGFAVSISGDVIVIGSEGEDHDSTGFDFQYNAGAAYVFERSSNGVWVEVQKLVAFDRNAEDSFGYSVYVSGNQIAVGALFEDHSPPQLNYKLNAGAAYIFQKNTSGYWNQMQKITAVDRSEEDYFGYNVAIQNNHVISGARMDNRDTSGANLLFSAGSAYFFNLIQGTGSFDDTFQQMASIQPNPSYDSFSIVMNDTYESISVRVLDLAGKQVYNHKFQQTSVCIVDADLFKGVYIVEISSNDGVKFILRLVRQ